MVACLLVLLAAPARADPAPAGDKEACRAAIAAEQARKALPPNLLAMIALVESGRLVGKEVVPWPWSVDADGTGLFFDTKADAVAAVQGLQAAGARSLDVGCMQINLRTHPDAFASLDDAFDPDTNTRYGAALLRSLFAASGSWALAMTAYHSATPGIAADYARRILAVWPGAAAYGLVAAEPGPDAMDGHDYTPEFAAQLAADAALLRARHPAAQPGALPGAGSLLRQVSASPRPVSARPAPPRPVSPQPASSQHGPAWPREPVLSARALRARP